MKEKRDRSKYFNTPAFWLVSVGYTANVKITTICMILESTILISLNGVADFCSRVADVSGRSSLPSATHHQLVVPSRIYKFGDRSISVAGPTAWNMLPDYIQVGRVRGYFYGPIVDVSLYQIVRLELAL